MRIYISDRIVTRKHDEIINQENKFLNVIEITYVYSGMIVVLSEPMGAKGPKFSSDDRVNSFIRAAGSAYSLHCPAQGYPVPLFR